MDLVVGTLEVVDKTREEQTRLLGINSVWLIIDVMFVTNEDAESENVVCQNGTVTAGCSLSHDSR